MHFQQAHVTRAFPTKVRDWTSVFSFSFILHLHFNMGFFYYSCRNSRRTGDFCHARLFVFIFIFLNFVPFFSDTRGFLRQRLHFNFNIWNSSPIFGGFNNKSDICVYGDIDVHTYIGIYICGRSIGGGGGGGGGQTPPPSVLVCTRPAVSTTVHHTTNIRRHIRDMAVRSHAETDTDPKPQSACT